MPKSHPRRHKADWDNRSKRCPSSRQSRQGTEARPAATDHLDLVFSEISFLILHIHRPPFGSFFVRIYRMIKTGSKRGSFYMRRKEKRPLSGPASPTCATHRGIGLGRFGLEAVTPVHSGSTGRRGVIRGVNWSSGTTREGSTGREYFCWGVFGIGVNVDTDTDIDIHPIESMNESSLGVTGHVVLRRN